MTKFFPTPLKLEDYPSTTLQQQQRQTDSPSPSKKRRVSSSTSTKQPDDSLLTSRLNSTLKLRDIWSDIARRHSLRNEPTNSSGREGRKHRPTGRTRAIPVEEDDIIDLRSLTIVQDRGMLRNSRKGIFSIGGYSSSTGQEAKEGKDTGFQIIDDDEDEPTTEGQGEGDEQGDWEDENSESDLWEEPSVNSEDSEDEFAEFDDLESLPSLKYREERRKLDERKRELRSFWEQELEWTGKSAWDTNENETREDKTGRGKEKDGRENEVLDEPVQAPQSREEFRREWLKSCTPRPVLRSQSTRPIPSSTTSKRYPATVEEEESDDEMNLTSFSVTPETAPIPLDHSPFSLPKSGSTKPFTTSTPSPRSVLTQSTTSTIRRKIETIDLSTSPPPTTSASFPSTSSPSPSSPTLSSNPASSKSSTTLSKSSTWKTTISPASKKVLSSSPSRFPGDRRSIFSRDSAPPPPDAVASELSKVAKKNLSPLRHSISANSGSESESEEGEFELERESPAVESQPQTYFALPPSPPNSKGSTVSTSKSSVSVKAKRIFGDHERRDPAGVEGEKESGKGKRDKRVQQRPTPEATPPPSTSSSSRRSPTDSGGRTNPSKPVEERAKRTNPKPTPIPAPSSSTFMPFGLPPSSAKSTKSESKKRRSESTFEIRIPGPAPPSSSRRTDRTASTTPVKSVDSSTRKEGKSKGKSKAEERMEMEDELDCFSLPSSPAKKPEKQERMELDYEESDRVQREEEERKQRKSYGLATPPFSKGKPSTDTPPTLETFKIPALPSTSSGKKKRSTLPSSSPSTPSTTPSRCQSTTTPSSSRSRISASSTPTPHKSPTSSLADYIRARSSPSVNASTSSPSSTAKPRRPRSQSSFQTASTPEKQEKEEEEEEEDDEFSISTPAPPTPSRSRKTRNSSLVSKVMEPPRQRPPSMPVESAKAKDRTPIRKPRRSPRLNSVTPSPSSRGKRSGTVILEEAPVVEEGEEEDELMMMG
ncbi:uncharacterized protein JCM6883_001215 [Sporobolomyces salmoneus]|uniref:uncharacterized protein n=1 Tax=Sporobolomyces salmoneus TaxID=183962 RepID=UPI003180742E